MALWNLSLNYAQVRTNTGHMVACSRLLISEDDGKSEQATSGISCKRDPGVERRGWESVSPINVIKTINVIPTINVIKIDHKCNTNHKCNNF